MEVSGDFVRRGTGTRIVAQRDPGDGDVSNDVSGERPVDFGIVVAGDPDPVAILLQHMQGLDVARGPCGRRRRIVQAVAERDDRFRLIMIDERRELVQRFARVVGRQHLTARGKRRSLLEMQVGNDQRLFGGPVERAGLMGKECLAANRETGWSAKSSNPMRSGFSMPMLRYPPSLRVISSSAASRRTASRS